MYRFESMESTAGGFAQIREVLDAMPRGFSTAMAEEEPYRFSLATQGQRTMAAALGVFNFVGVAVLGYLCSDPSIAMRKAELVGAVSALLPGLQAYAFAFFAIPAFRWFVQSRKNAQIEGRNEARLEASRQVARPGKLLAAKIEAARRAADGDGGKRGVLVARARWTTRRRISSSARGAESDDATAVDDFERRLRERNPGA